MVALASSDRGGLGASKLGSRWRWQWWWLAWMAVALALACSGHNKHGNSDSVTKNGNITKESESCNETEWVEQDEPGVYIILTALPGSVKDLKKVRFSRKRLSEKQAEQWWAENRARVYEQYNVRMVDKSSVGVGSVDLAQ